MYSQENITEYCLTDEEKKERERGKEKDQNNNEVEEETFSESFSKHTLLWLGLFSFLFTTILGIIGIIILILKIHKIKHPKRPNTLTGKENELSSKFLTQSEGQ
jgi:hypothetical protein